MIFEWMLEPQSWIALLTLTWLEIILGIDNIIFLSILVSKLPVQQRNIGRIIGLGLAMVTRILLLISLVWIIKLTKPLFSIFNMSFSIRDLILILGGLFLMAKSTKEIHFSLEGPEDPHTNIHSNITHFWSVMIQIAIIDIVFSLDSVITAVGLANQLPIMILAIIISVIIMMFASKTISHYVETHPTLKMLALSFLILIGVALLGEGLNFTIPKGYIYFAMAFSFGVEMLNLKLKSNQDTQNNTTQKIKLKKVL